ncbi:MAG: bifunctional oligoribonuclease/PAP phosphatase NrnA [Clostridiales bacterium]|nr:bifunctional oligoribonuclease/PAP phosphatase NrnA [Clostridiales bacterium]MBS5877726.1 bifunctional oligoribonuclease/PAP phosphatase NrnA [Clostridiales bacterium]MDU0939635.1 bifunctional oligoribonuclease/PAP phosphatase NrnA [Clostridiales bacterium]MDU1042558.1 bifunctional oligoribonuclease/PAP phosphatase NrnA [Clostridiales bacterium]MDU3490314.1 bifunctional oligoribonuclease/PAP phosphatase NrnA [Clostridiales bacterium]
MDLTAILENAKKVAVTGHVNPDGDCVGSTLALYRYICLNFSNIQTDIYLEKPNNDFNYLAGIDEIKHEPDTEAEYDVFFTLDCASEDRIKPFASCYKKSRLKVCIDHHVSNSGIFADENEIRPSASSTCEVLFDLLDHEKIDTEIAKCLYTGIIHDTGVFKYQSTSPHTLNIASRLIEFGFDFTSIIDDTFFSRTYNANKALGIVLSKSELFLDGYGIYSILTPEEMESVNVPANELGGIVEQLRLTAGVETAMFIYPGAGAKKISMRSKKHIDVAAFAGMYGGGGHVRAAGFASFKGYKEIIDDFIAYVEKNR